MSGFWFWYAQLPDFSNRHPVLGLLISGAILFAMLVVVTHPFQVIRLVFRLLFRGIDRVAEASGSISAVKRPLPGPTAQPPVSRVVQEVAEVKKQNDGSLNQSVVCPLTGVAREAEKRCSKGKNEPTLKQWLKH